MISKNNRVASSPSLLIMGGDQEILKKSQTYTEIEQQTSQITDETICATQRMLAMAYQAESYGSKSLETLSIQNEQLRNVNNKLHGINSNINISNGLLASIRSWLFPSWYKSKLIKLDNLELETGVTLDSIIPQEEAVCSIPRTGSSADLILNENLTQLGESLNRLKIQALSINQELDESNKLLCTINPTCNKVAANLGMIGAHGERG